MRKLRRVLPDALFLVEDAHMGRLVSAPFPDGELHGEPRIVDFEELCQVSATRVTLRAPTRGRPHPRGARPGRPARRRYAVGWTAWLDVAPDG